MSDSSFIPPPASGSQEGQARSHSLRNRLVALGRHPLLTFFVLAFGIEWILFGVSWVFGFTSTAVGFALFALLLSYGVTLAAVITLTLLRSREESAALWRRLLTWRVGPGWYLLALLLPCGFWLCGITVFALFGFHRSIQPSALALLPALFVINLGEEIGWRGFALPQLQARFNAVTAAVVLGVIWSLFHLPVYYQRPLFYLIFALLILALSIIITWIFNRTQGSILVMVLFHCSLNVSLNIFPAPEASLNGTLAVMAALAWLVAGLLILRSGPNLSHTPATPVVPVTRRQE
jgi:membrane protease YdiL (CAAX protease family)